METVAASQNRGTRAATSAEPVKTIRAIREHHIPVRAAAAIIQAVESPQPPLHLVLGKDALKMIRGKLDRLHHDLDAWEPTTLAADFPDA